jgi:hypothetical protein
MTSVAFMKGTPTRGSVNSAPPFSFGSSPGIGADYSQRPSVAALQNPTMHNKVPEAMVNPTARAPLFVRPFTRGFEKEYSEGDILFVRRDDSRASSTHNVVANLPVLNHLLRTTKVDGSDILKYTSLAKILADWNYFGILNNDMDTGSKWQRLLNINVRGRSRVARLWKPDGNGILQRGQMLWLGIFESKVKRNETFCGPKGMREPMKKGTTYFEVCATMDCCATFEQAQYLLPVGIVSQVTLRKPTDVMIQKAHSVTETCKSLERIEVLMRI